jgi:hypothetical protein
VAYAYSLDPQTGLPVLQTPGGRGLPLPLSQEQMAQSGAALAPPPGVDPGANPYAQPNMSAVAGPGGGEPYRVHLPPPGQVDISNLTDGGPRIIPLTAPGSSPAVQAYLRNQPPPVTKPAPQELKASWGPVPGEKRPVKLAEPKGEPPSASESTSQGDGLDPSVAKVMDYRAPSGPSGLQVGSEELKFRRTGAIDPTLAKQVQADQADVDASEWSQVQAHAERQDNVLTAQYAENQRRNDELQADRVRRQAINDQLQQLQTVRAAREQDAESMKAPEAQDYWKDKSFGSKIATAISLIAGGALQGLRGGSNPGMDALQQNIDRWVASQKEEYERARGAVSAADNHYKQALDLYGSPEQAEADLRIRASAVADAQLQNTALKIGTQDALANAQIALKANKLQREQLAAAAQQAAGPEVTQKLSMHYAGAGVSNDPLARLKRGAEATEYEDKITHRPAKGAPDTAVRFPGGETYYDRTPENAIKTQKEVQANDEVIQSVAELKRLTQEASSRAPGSAERGAATVKAKALIFKLHDAMGISGFRPGVAEQIHEMSGDPDALFRSPNAAAKLDTVAEEAQHKLHFAKKYLNVRPGAGGGGGSPVPAPAPSEEAVEE